jgi:hypothetical protein
MAEVGQTVIEDRLLDRLGHPVGMGARAPAILSSRPSAP